MTKKKYIMPSTVVMLIKTDDIMISQSMNVDSSHTVIDDNAVYSRRNSKWDFDEDEEFE